jgi:DNA-binding transcriptional LysR family regulator
LQINPRQVEAFRLIMLRGSVTLASKELEISQPAVSRLLRDFELRVGFPLFERRGNHLVPTPEANLLFAEVERSFTGLREIASFAEKISSQRTGALRVVAFPAMAMGFIPRFVGEFISGRELRQVFLHGMPSHLVFEAVATGQAEVGFAAVPFGRPGLTTEPLAARAVAVLPPRHRLAAQQLITPDHLAGEPFISLDDGSLFGAEIKAALAEVPCETVVTTPLSGIACSLVLAGAGIAVVDPFSASDFEDRGLTIRPFRPAINTRIVTITSARNRLSRVAEEFIASMRVHVAAIDRRFGEAPARRTAR